ncbi:DUF3307 domain-containing protein [Pseudanabaena sp. 'Roaring Creek']|uniref:DUF3307 domain-containing protein n=1 Tax=Pseudanabaena sp. 'Roaring Creek' TaxID=1681830 RepID=UPI0006D79EAE|nr:DUF3307 domain-containing protein [Pseudanabaena sp. 'Roaring Creek']
MNNYFYYGLLFHFVGDYLLQNDWMAQNKTKENFPAIVHALIYGFPFLLLVYDPYVWTFVVVLSHYLIDRYRLAVYWIKLVNWNWSSTNFGYADDKPMWMSVWLMIIIDNVLHVLFNTLAIAITNIQ